MRMRAKFFWESFEGNSQKFSIIENEGSIFESFYRLTNYTFLTKFITTGFTPFFTLSCLKICIFRTVKRSRKDVQRSRNRKIPKSIILTLGCRFILYPVCNSSKLILNCIELKYFSIIVGYENLDSFHLTYFEILLILNDLGLVVNCSVNIIFYTFFNDQFKTRLLKLLLLECSVIVLILIIRVFAQSLDMTCILLSYFGYFFQVVPSTFISVLTYFVSLIL